MILHIPHSSSLIPDDVRETFVLSDKELKAELLTMTDAFTDELFSLANGEATRIVYPVSRLVTDPERFTDDSQEPMAQKGLGVVYMKTSEGRVLRDHLSALQRQELIDRYYRPHHLALRDAVEAELNGRGEALIIDCHSFPASPLPYEDDQNPDRPDICIGTDRYHTPPELADSLIRSCREVGFSVAVNRPFAGSMVPLDYYEKDSRVQSIMIEINRRLYMDERTGKKNQGFEKTLTRIRSALENLL